MAKRPSRPYPEPMKPEDNAEWLNAKEAAYVLGCSVNHVYISTRNGTMPHMRLGRRRIYRRKDLELLLKSLPGVTVKQAVERRQAEIDESIDAWKIEHEKRLALARA